MGRASRIAAMLVLGLGWVASAADLDQRGMQPAIASGDAGLVAVVYGEKQTVACAVSHDGGRTFAAPVQVGQVAGQMVGMRRGPQIAARGRTLIIVTNGAGNRIMRFRSLDAGMTWTGPEAIDNPAERSAEGLMSLCATRDGFVLVFLELVDGATRIASMRSTDDGVSWGRSRLVYASADGHVCECCQPTIASDRAGNVAVMFRNWLDGDRDMYVSMSTDDGETFQMAQKAGEGSWRLDACPMDGGGITVARTVGKAAWDGVWRRKNTVFASRAGQAEEALGDGSQPVIAPSPNGVVIAWVGKRGIVVRSTAGEHVVPQGKAPVLAPADGGTILAYETAAADGAHVRTKVFDDVKAP